MKPNLLQFIHSYFKNCNTLLFELALPSTFAKVFANIKAHWNFRTHKCATQEKLHNYSSARLKKNKIRMQVYPGKSRALLFLKHNRIWQR